jgi:hypothetical protein
VKIVGENSSTADSPHVAPHPPELAEVMRQLEAAVADDDQFYCQLFADALRWLRELRRQRDEAEDHLRRAEGLIADLQKRFG